MKVYDSVKKEEVEVNGTKGLIDIMRDGRQVDLYLKEKKSDADGYMSWDNGCGWVYWFKSGSKVIRENRKYYNCRY